MSSLQKLEQRLKDLKDKKSTAPKYSDYARTDDIIGYPTKSLTIIEEALSFEDSTKNAVKNLQPATQSVNTSKEKSKPESSVVTSITQRYRHNSDFNTSKTHPNTHTQPTAKKHKPETTIPDWKQPELPQPVLRSYHSTSDCKTVGLLSAIKKTTSKRAINLRPMRIPVSQMQQLKKVDSRFHDDDDDEDDEDGLSGIIPMRKGSGSTTDSGYLSQSSITQPTTSHGRKYSLMEIENSHDDSAAAGGTDIEMKRKYSLMDVDMSPESARPHVVDKENKDPKIMNERTSDNKESTKSDPQSTDNVFVRPPSGDSKTLKPILSFPSTWQSKSTGHMPQVTPMKNIIDNSSSHSLQQIGVPLLTPTTYGMVLPGNTPSNGTGFSLPFKCTPVVKPKSNQMMIVNNKSYSVLNMIGRGGTSKVYQVFCAESKKTLAVKKVDLEGCDDATIQGYLNEINLLHQLQDCDSVVKMYDCEYNVDDSTLLVVMEQGDTDLSRLFCNRQKKPFSENAIMFYWQCMLEAVQSLHQRGIVHSDLKPANFLLVAGHLKLIDFGIANAIQPDKTSVTRQQQIGTPNYMSPEAIYSRGHHMDGTGRPQPKYKLGVASDVWSLGCILYNMVYGHTPFQSYNNITSKLQAIVNPAVPIPFPDVNDKNVVDVLKKCLQRDPKRRPPVSELLKHPYLVGSKSPEPATGQEELISKLGKVALNQILANSSPGHIGRALTELLMKQNTE